LEKRIKEIYGDVLGAAREGEKRCFEGKRWKDHAILIIVDAALDSIGLNYFQIVVPRVRLFYQRYVRTGQIATLEALSKLTAEDPRIRRIMNNRRCWEAAINICKELVKVKEENHLGSDFAALRFWAEGASHERWKEDLIGKIPGVGLITFQYLRMQAGVDTTMPDKIVKREMERNFGIKAQSNLEFVEKVEEFSRETGYSQTILCWWAIWLKKSNMKKPDWEHID